MSDKVHFEYTKFKVGAPMPPAGAAAAIPAASVNPTGNQLPSAVPASGGSATASVMRRNGAAATTQQVTVTKESQGAEVETITLETVEDAPAMGIMKNYNRIIVFLPSEVWATKNAPHKLTIFVAKRMSSEHYVNKTMSALIRPDEEPTRVSMDVKALKDSDVSDIKTVIEKMNAAAVKRFPNMDSTMLSKYLAKGKHWNFEALGHPIIESVVWEKVSNNCQYNSVGIRFDEVVDGTVRQSGQDKLRKITYIDSANFDNEQEFQIVIEPAVSSVQQSDSAHHHGALLIQDHADEDDPFIVNSTVKQLNALTENTTVNSAGQYVRVNLHDLHILWGLINLPDFFDQYTEAVRNNEGGKGTEEYNGIVNNSARTNAVSQRLREISEQTGVSIGHRISEVIWAVNNLFDNESYLNTNGLFSMEMGDEAPYYRMPKLLHNIIIKEYLAQAKKHQVFNNATQLEISGKKLPAYKSKTARASDYVENNPVAVVQFKVRFYYPKIGHTYCRTDFETK